MLTTDRVPAFTPENKLELLAIARRILAHHEKQLMRDVLAGLTPKQLDVALCVYFLDMTHAEAAKVLGRSGPVTTKIIERIVANGKANVAKILAARGTKKKTPSVYIS